MVTKSKGVGRGGRRKNAGRPKGSQTQRTRAVALRAKAEGITPLEVIVRTMRELWDRANKGPELNLELAQRACDIGKDAMPYMHARISPIARDPDAATVDPSERRLSELEYARRIAYLLKVGVLQIPKEPVTIEHSTGTVGT